MMADKTRDAIAKTAKMMYDHNRKNGGDMTRDQARRNVERAREQGDRKRNENKR